MQTNTSVAIKSLALTYGQCQALKVMVAYKMGLNPCNVTEAELLMRSGKIHSMDFASVDREASRVHNTLASSLENVAQANRIGQSLLVEYELA